MKDLKKLQILGDVHSVILSRRKGAPADIAKSLGISRSSFYYYLQELELMGAMIKYSRSGHCFFYEEEFKLKIVIETSELSRTIGGRNK